MHYPLPTYELSSCITLCRQRALKPLGKDMHFDAVLERISGKWADLDKYLWRPALEKICSAAKDGEFYPRWGDSESWGKGLISSLIMSAEVHRRLTLDLNHNIAKDIARELKDAHAKLVSSAREIINSLEIIKEISLSSHVHLRTSVDFDDTSTLLVQAARENGREEWLESNYGFSESTETSNYPPPTLGELLKQVAASEIEKITFDDPQLNHLLQLENGGGALSFRTEMRRFLRRVDDLYGRFDVQGRTYEVLDWMPPRGAAALLAVAADHPIDETPYEFGIVGNFFSLARKERAHASIARRTLSLKKGT